MFLSKEGVVRIGGIGMYFPQEFVFQELGRTDSSAMYMAPEIIDDHASIQSIVWSLGITLIEMAEGKNPFSGCVFSALLSRIRSKTPPTLSSQWSPSFVGFVNACLTRNVKERPSIDEMLIVRDW